MAVCCVTVVIAKVVSRLEPWVPVYHFVWQLLQIQCDSGGGAHCRCAFAASSVRNEQLHSTASLCVIRSWIKGDYTSSACCALGTSKSHATSKGLFRPVERTRQFNGGKFAVSPTAAFDVRLHARNVTRSLVSDWLLQQLRCIIQVVLIDR